MNKQDLKLLAHGHNHVVERAVWAHCFDHVCETIYLAFNNLSHVRAPLRLERERSVLKNSFLTYQIAIVSFIEDVKLRVLVAGSISNF